MDGSWRLLAVAGWCQSQWGCCTKNHHVSTLVSSTLPWLPVCMEDAELLFTHDIMFASNVKVVPQQCCQYITQHIKDTILTSKEANFVSGLYHVFQFYYHSESSWWVFADKSKRSVLTTGHCGKLLATKATVRTFWFFCQPENSLFLCNRWLPDGGRPVSGQCVTEVLFTWQNIIMSKMVDKLTSHGYWSHSYWSHDCKTSKNIWVGVRDILGMKLKMPKLQML